MKGAVFIKSERPDGSIFAIICSTCEELLAAAEHMWEQDLLGAECKIEIKEVIYDHQAA